MADEIKYKAGPITRFDKATKETISDCPVDMIVIRERTSAKNGKAYLQGSLKIGSTWYNFFLNEPSLWSKMSPEQKALLEKQMEKLLGK